MKQVNAKVFKADITCLNAPTLPEGSCTPRRSGQSGCTSSSGTDFVAPATQSASRCRFAAAISLPARGSPPLWSRCLSTKTQKWSETATRCKLMICRASLFVFCCQMPPKNKELMWPW